jgi:hypothetical protein
MGLALINWRSCRGRAGWDVKTYRVEGGVRRATNAFLKVYIGVYFSYLIATKVLYIYNVRV